ncbi:MAG: SurA N-terminal domain-containing protein [Amaricoccus sp.]|uniref:peptidylprolyl isomerase n=1 Tax=Amaricoccus sp. TaxID=1872485 RepID=UPI0039E443A0
MLGSFRNNRRSGLFVWALMVAIMVGLAGFGIGVSGHFGTGTDIATVGDEKVSTDEYVRAMQQELRALQQQVGRSLPMAEARQYGVDGMVLGRLVNDAALDGEAARLGISTGDDAVRQQILATPAFRGPSGTFDKATYDAALQRAGLRPDQFEALLRSEASRNLLAAAIPAAAQVPDTEAKSVLAFLGEKRGFDWIRLDAAKLPAPIAAPTDADLAAFHDAHAADRYTRPETRQVSYAAVTPAALAATIEIPDADLRAAYDAEGARFQTPERRALDRLAFGTMDEAAAARSRLDKGEIDFDALATERGLKPGDTDQGTVAAADLPEAVRDAVFGAAGPGIVGPVDTPLGPSLYRVNAILAARTTPFEEAKADLTKDVALDRAKKQIADDGPHIEDLVAGGATLEEIASETVMELGHVSLNATTSDAIASDPAFRAAAEKAEVGEETDPVQLADGGIATLRVDSIDPPAVIPLAEIRDRVAADWTSDQTVAALQTLADGDVAALKAGTSFADVAKGLDLPIQSAGPLTRGDTVPGLPPELVADIFAAAPGAAVTRRDGDSVVLAVLTTTTPLDLADPANAPILARLQQQYDDQIRGDVLALYTGALRAAEGVTVNQSLVEFDPRPVPLSPCNSSPPSTTSPPRSTPAGTRSSTPASSPTSTRPSR